MCIRDSSAGRPSSRSKRDQCALWVVHLASGRDFRYIWPASHRNTARLVDNQTRHLHDPDILLAAGAPGIDAVYVLKMNVTGDTKDASFAVNTTYPSPLANAS
eukprot:1816570-Prorocentrum_lima.AAC.1